eukprot:5568655-Prymnesium_polylepis.1
MMLAHAIAAGGARHWDWKRGHIHRSSACAWLGCQLPHAAERTAIANAAASITRRQLWRPKFVCN